VQDSRILFICLSDPQPVLTALSHCCPRAQLDLATSAQQGLQLAESKGRPRLVLLDVGADCEAALEIAMRMRKLPRLQAVRIVALVDQAHDHLVARSTQAGIHSVVHKPVDADELTRRVRLLYEFWVDTNEGARDY
jgi:CheY-like chemotaxis protein